MAHPGFNPADERVWWWKVAKHLDDAQLALINAIAHNVDDPRPLQELQARLRDGQAMLLHIFYAKGLLPAPPVPPAHVPRNEPSAPPPVPPPAWTTAPAGPPPPWFPADIEGDIAAAAAAAAAAAVMSPAPAPDQSADPSEASSEPAGPTNGEAHPAVAETVNVNVDAAPVEPAPPSTEVVEAVPSPTEAVPSPAEASRSTDTPSSDATT